MNMKLGVLKHIVW